MKRPSLHCKTPYMADVIIESSSGETAQEVLAHTPSLGCCGLAEKESNVILSKIDSKTAKSSHRVELAIHRDGPHEEIVGINPKLSETIGTLSPTKLYRRYTMSRAKAVTYLNSVLISWCG